MEVTICVRESVYRYALTRGSQYTVLAIDNEKRQLQIRGDNGRTRWFPAYCFDKGDRSVPRLATFYHDVPIRPDEEKPIEVTVHLTNGERRWCVFATPSDLASCGDWIEGTRVPFHYGNRHIVIARDLSEELIHRMLHYIDSQGDLMECTLPLDPVDD